MKSMIAFFALLTTIVTTQGAAPPDVRERFEVFAKDCENEVGVSSDEAKLAFNHVLPQNDKERCYLECIYKAAGIVQDGKFSKEGTRKVAAARTRDSSQDKKDKADQLVDTCAEEVKAKDGEKCSLGRAIRECFVNNGKNMLN